jgi:hypothetical protein
MTMKTRTLIAMAAGILVLAAAGGAAAPAQDSAPPVKGKVVTWSNAAQSLDKRLDAAREDFRKSNGGDLFFTGYVFPSRSTIHHSIGGHDGPFEVRVDGIDVEFRGRGDSESIETTDRGGPAGLLVLNSLSKAKTPVLSAHLLDPAETYEFKKVPVYWLGSVEAEASVACLEGIFERGGEDVRKSLVFVISQHNTPRAFDFLKKAALGALYGHEVQKDAIFWVGSTKDPRSLDLLKEIYGRTTESELKEQVVFALTLPDSKEAVLELIRLARTERDVEVKKNAIFWLGQKASQESVKALKGFVDEPSEEVEVKESAVFAISQLPEDKAVPMLAAIARENRSPAVRKKALFWLGQTGSEEALKIFQEILLKK